MQLKLPLDGAMDTVKPVTSCEHCSRALYEHQEVLVVTKHFGSQTDQLHFCGEPCANEYYMERLREGGL